MTELNIINLFCGMRGDELGIRDEVDDYLKPVRFEGRIVA